MTTPLPLIGLILAGGKSRRMGKDKALLSLHGETLLARAERLLRDCGAREVHVLGRPDHPRGTPDETPYAGPAAAVAAWLAKHSIASQILVIPVDMPHLTPAVLTPLISAGSACYGEHYLPFTALVPAPPPPPAVRVRDLLDSLGVTRLKVPVGPENAFTNINTPDDLAAVREEGLP